jgi:hypothetical protein
VNCEPNRTGPAKEAGSRSAPSPWTVAEESRAGGGGTWDLAGSVALDSGGEVGEMPGGEGAMAGGTFL